jgi:hypothetical protein
MFSHEKQAAEQVTEMCGRNFGWAKNKQKDRGITEDGIQKQIDHANLSGWQTRPQTSQASSSYKIFSSPSNARNMAEQKKQERDFTPEVDAIIPEATSLAEVSRVYSPNIHVLTVLYSRANFRKLLINSWLLKSKQEMWVTVESLRLCSTK